MNEAGRHARRGGTGRATCLSLILLLGLASNARAEESERTCPVTTWAEYHAESARLEAEIARAAAGLRQYEPPSCIELDEGPDYHRHCRLQDELSDWEFEVMEPNCLGRDDAEWDVHDYDRAVLGALTPLLSDDDPLIRWYAWLKISIHCAEGPCLVDRYGEGEKDACHAALDLATTRFLEHRSPFLRFTAMLDLLGRERPLTGKHRARLRTLLRRPPAPGTTCPWPLEPEEEEEAEPASWLDEDEASSGLTFDDIAAQVESDAHDCDAVLASRVLVQAQQRGLLD
ncbi:MAG: hypothetical protein AAF533_04050 [Acidobacteriota bacterium]